MTLADAAGPAFVFGVANAAHCAGMCGLLAVRSDRAGRFAAYALGKTATYAALGTVAGALGASVAASVGRAGAWLGVGAALVTIVLGVRGLRPPRAAAREGLWADVLAPVSDVVARARSTGSSFVLGAATGLLPCGVLYAAAAQAAATASPVRGALALAAFGAGTVPVLAAVALVGRGALLRVGPARVRTAGALVVLATGVVLLVRSVPAILAEGGAVPRCH